MRKRKQSLVSVKLRIVGKKPLVGFNGYATSVLQNYRQTFSGLHSVFFEMKNDMKIKLDKSLGLSATARKMSGTRKLLARPSFSPSMIARGMVGHVLRVRIKSELKMERFWGRVGKGRNTSSRLHLEILNHVPKNPTSFGNWKIHEC
jgi:hypothetical protein